MVCYPAGDFELDVAGFQSFGHSDMEPFCIDRFEVTNRQFKKFVDAGGYRRREYWRQPLLENGRVVAWEDAMKRFVDSSRRPGPATWEAGSFRDGQDDLPVGGVSWYEAAAYAEFAGKSLPTFYHWYQASGVEANSAMVELSNFGGKGVAAVGTYRGVSPRGVFDLAGNVREWTWTQTGRRRYSLGGAWNEPVYYLTEWENPSPFDRDPENGFRCATYQGGRDVPAQYAGALEKAFRDYRRETPVSDETFNVFERLYPRDSGPLEARIESEDNASSANWRQVTVSYAAGYGGERLPAYLFLPKNAIPPYQAVIWFPGSGVLEVGPGPVMAMDIDFIVRSGRAVLYPVYKGTYK